MSDHIHQAIVSLEQEIEALDQRRGELQRAVDAMRPLAGERSTRKGSKPRKGRTDGRTDGRTEQKARRRRSLPDEKGAAILDALRWKSPQSPSDLAKALKMPRSRLTAQVKPLLKRGAVVATGGGPRNRQFSLPGRSKAPKEAP